MDRRRFLACSAAVCATGYASKTVANIRIGEGTLTTVSDGSLSLPVDLPNDVPANELATLAGRFGLERGDVTERPLNVTLWRSRDRTVLFDAGSGPAFVDSAGVLVENLDAAGVLPEDVTDVIFTHAHPDHIWGILDDFDEIPFPNARLYLGQTEFDYWSDPATFDSLPETLQFFAVGAQRRLDAIADRLELIGSETEVAPGITSVATFGHTPGHMSYVIESGGERSMILGDCVTNAHLHFARPGWPSANDQDAPLAGATRMRILSELASSGMRIVGYHLPNGGIGRVERDGDGYVFVAEET